MTSALWLAGFRPLFLLALISGVGFPIAWGLIYSGRLQLPAASLPLTQWHAHEMLYGFGWAVLGGFLLTASKNWVKIRGIHGPPLALITAAWILERLVVLQAARFPEPLRLILLNVFILACADYVLYSLIRYRKQDSFKDNYFFMIGLPIFLIAKNMILFQETYADGVALSVGLYRLAFAVMLERTTTQFMKNALSVHLTRNARLDTAIKFLVLASAFSSFLPSLPSALLLGATGTLMFARYLTWSPLAGLSNFGIAIMYIGHLGLIFHFLFEAVKVGGVYAGVGTLSLHVFTFICMGLIIPGMLLRISHGHTGRTIRFTTSDRLGFLSIFLGAIARLILTQVWPQYYMKWILLSAIGWALGFLIIGTRIAPFLWQPRVDGRVH